MKFTLAILSALAASHLTQARPNLHNENVHYLPARATTDCLAPDTTVPASSSASLATGVLVAVSPSASVGNAKQLANSGGGRTGSGGGRGGNRNGGGRTGNNGGNTASNNGNGNNGNTASTATDTAAAANTAGNDNNNDATATDTASATDASTASAAATSAAATSAAATSAAVAVAANENGEPGPAVPVLTFDGSKTLDDSIVQDTASNGNPTAGQANSATSNNNFIGFCEGKTITNGLQVKTGSCNPIPMGDIPSTQNMITTVFTEPANMATITAGQTFTIGLKSSGITLGSFVNAQANYYSAPQQLDSSGQIVGHAHITVQKMESISSTALLDPNTFAFFKGLDFTDVNGLSTIDVEGGLAAGAYRMCTIMSASNHQSAVMPIAQRGAENTCNYFIVQ